MIRILTIVGARPQFIKASAFSRAVKSVGNGTICEDILHTGQHYDDNMSGVFFSELGIEEPKFLLSVSFSDNRVEQMTSGIVDVIKKSNYDYVLVYGDTDSTYAGAIAAVKCGVPLIHIEAGLRSGNSSMVEERNRIYADRHSKLLFAPTAQSLENLKSECIGVNDGNVAVNSGDVMYDSALHYCKNIADDSRVLLNNGLIPDNYALVTIHRAQNTDDITKLSSIMESLIVISTKCDVILPLHPRTKKAIAGLDIEMKLKRSNVKVIDPVPYLDMLALEKFAKVVLTDSGGVQKESYFMGVPVVVLRNETEWTEIVEVGMAFVAGTSVAGISDAFENAMNIRNSKPETLFGDGHAAEHIVRKIIKETQSGC